MPKGCSWTIPTSDEELRKFQSISVNLDVPIRLYKEPYDKQDMTGYESITKFICIQLRSHDYFTFYTKKEKTG